jgi:hypothetical protein
MTRLSLRVLSLSSVLCLASVPAAAVTGSGGGSMPPVPPEDEGSRAASTTTASSYTEESVARSGLAEDELASGEAGGLPDSIHAVDGTGDVTYRRLDDGRWKVKVEIAARHEQVDALYDLVMVLPLPEGFESDGWRIPVNERVGDDVVPVVYSGERVRLKRNQPLEASWLPLLVGGPQGLPDLAGTGYRWTLWDTIIRYDEHAGRTLEGFGVLAYTADASVTAPDAADPRNAVYLVSWIPSLDASIAPLALRIDVASDEE